MSPTLRKVLKVSAWSALACFTAGVLLIASMLFLPSEARAVRGALLDGGPRPSARFEAHLGIVPSLLIRCAGRLTEPFNPEAGAALRSLRSVAVGVYQGGPGAPADGAALASLDKALAADDWRRLVLVRESDKQVLVYTRDSGDEDTLSLCVAVREQEQTVLVSVSLDPEQLGRLATLAAARGGLHLPERG